MTKYDTLAFLAPQKKLPANLSPELLSQDLCLSVTAAPPFDIDGETLLKTVRMFRRTIEDQGVTIVLSKSDLEKPGLKVILNLQNPPPTIGLIPKLFDEGIRICQIAYQGKNIYGGGFLSPLEPLTSNGHSLVLEMKKSGMIVDLAHAGAVTSLDALKIIEENEMPVMISHTGIYDLHCNMRNTIYEVLRRVAELRGLVGVYTLTFGLSNDDNSIEPLVRHMAYMFDILHGRDAVCVGSDTWYCEDNGTWKETYDFLSKNIDPLGLMQARFPDQIAELMTSDKMSLIHAEIEKKRSSQGTADMICSENPHRFFTENLPQ